MFFHLAHPVPKLPHKGTVEFVYPRKHKLEMERPSKPRWVTRVPPLGTQGVGVREECPFQVATDAWLPPALSLKRKEFLPSPFLV